MTKCPSDFLREAKGLNVCSLIIWNFDNRLEPSYADSDLRWYEWMGACRPQLFE